MTNDSDFSKGSLGPSLAHHVWEGTHAEIGRQHGEALRQQIADFCDFAEGSFSPWLGGHGTADATVREHATALLEASRAYDPGLIEELRGVATGSNQPLARIALINAFLDLLPLAGAPEANGFVGCTTVGVAHFAGAANRVLLAQNYDVWGALRPLAVTAQLTPPHAPEALIFTFAGVLGCAGLNSQGLGVAINYLDAGRSGVGVMYPAILRRALAQRRIGDAVGSVVLPRRGCSLHYMVGSVDGVVIGLETTPDEFARLDETNGVLSHSNHFLSGALADQDAMMHVGPRDSRVARPGSSIVRHYVMAKLMRRAGQPDDLTKVQEALRNHVNHPFSICFHGDDALEEPVRSQTVASMVFDLQDRVIWISDGSHHGPYRRVDFSTAV